MPSDFSLQDCVSQFRSAIVVSKTLFCFTDFPTVNNFGLQEAEVPDWEEVNDTRFFVACFVEPVFNKDYPLF